MVRLFLFSVAKLRILCDIKEHLFPNSPFRALFLKRAIDKNIVPLHPNSRDNRNRMKKMRIYDKFILKVN